MFDFEFKLDLAKRVMVTRRKSFIYGQIDVDSIICRLTQTEQWKRDIDVSEHEIKMVCTLARQIFLQQPMLLELNAPLKIAGKFFNNFFFQQF